MAGLRAFGKVYLCGVELIIIEKYERDAWRRGNQKGGKTIVSPRETSYIILLQVAWSTHIYLLCCSKLEFRAQGLEQKEGVGRV